MKITIKLPKPRNPQAMPARKRKAGAHDSFRPERRARRLEKQRLHRLMSGRAREGEES